MVSLVSLPPLAIEGVTQCLSCTDRLAVLGVCKSTRDSAWLEAIVPTIRLRFPPSVNETQARIAALDSVTRANCTTLRIPDVDVLPELVAAFRSIRHLVINTIEYKWSRVLTLSAAQLKPLRLSLRSLDLSRSGIVDVTALGQLTYLEELSLRSAPVTDISPLGSLINLRHLILTYTRVASIECVTGMHALESLDLCRTQVQDLSPLTDLKYLHILKITTDRVDATSIGSFGASLRVFEASPYDLSQEHYDVTVLLSKQLHLRQLAFFWSQNSSLEVLSSMTKLQELSIFTSMTPMRPTELDPMRNFTSLRKLTIGHLWVESTEPLGYLSNLEELSLGFRPSHLAPPVFFGFMARLPLLRQLSFRDADAVSSLSDHIPSTTLTSLHIGGSPKSYAIEMPMKLLERNPNLRILELTVPCAPDVPNLDTLPSLRHLKKLQVRRGYGRTEHRSSSFMKWLGTLTQLESLTLWYVPMLNLLPLRRLTNLRTLVVSGDFRTVAPIETLTSLEVLELSSHHQMDFLSLLGLKKLRHLRLPEYIDCAPFRSLPCLETLVHCFGGGQSCLGLDPVPCVPRLDRSAKRARRK